MSIPTYHAGAHSKRGIWLFSALAIVYLLLTLDVGYITGAGPFWQSLVGDAAQGQIGWFYYARDAWRLPIFAIGNYHLPEGGNVLLSDSLPLFALPAKAIYGLFWAGQGNPPIYLGLWVALCFFLQVVVAYRLLVALGIRRWLPQLAGVALFAYLPMFFARFGHATLMAHFLIVFALGSYVEAKQRGLTSRGWTVLCVVPIMALWISPYIVAMTGILVLATILDQWREHRIERNGVVLRLAAMSIGAIAVAGVSGFLGISAGNFNDYGVYSLNLLSPVVPFPQTTLGQWLHTEHPNLSGIHQWEGGGYLGAGLLMLCLAALPALRNWRAALHRHVVLFVILIAMLVFAISNRVGLGSLELVHVPLPDAWISVLSNLRGSGRFVWVAVYVLLAGCIATICRFYQPRTATVLLVTAAILQIIDVAPMQRALRSASASAATAQIDTNAWTELIAEHEEIFQFPSFDCGGLFGNGVPGVRTRELEIDWIAARLGKPTNSAYLARPTKDCERERLHATSEFRRPGTLHLYRSTDDIGSLLAEHGEYAVGCGSLDDVVVCSASRDLSSFSHSTLK